MKSDRYITVAVFLCIFMLISVAFLPSNVSAQLTDEWKKTYGGPASDIARSHVFTEDGGVLAAGSTRSFGEGKLSNYFLVKTNKNGFTQWRKTFGGEYDDRAQEVIKTDDGGYAVAGSSESFQGRAQNDFYMIKLDEKGNQMWDAGFGGKYEERCYSVRQTSDGGYLMVGSSVTYGGRGEDFWAVKTNEEGEVIEEDENTWKRAYGGDGDDICRSVVKTDDGNYILAGYTDSFGDPGQGAWIVKINEQGEEIWNRTNGGIFDDYVYDVTQTKDGGYVYVGSTTSYGKGEESFWMVKTNSTGHELWNYSSDGGYEEIAYSVENTPEGEYIMAGYTTSYGKPGKNVWVVEIGTEGKEISKETFGGDRDEVAHSITISDDGKISVAGYTSSFGAGEEDFWVIRIGRGKKLDVLWVGIGSIVLIATVYIVYKLSKRYGWF